MSAKHRLFASAAIAIVTMAAAGPANASGDRPAYDRKIEEAAIRILQGKLGDLRGPFDLEPGAVARRQAEPETPWDQLDRKPKYARITWR